ncbi:MAG: terpene cyclase/mutase family protein [Lentisphaerales bacterium]|nr:terpene cyclase/mutase family protein [Lentisphaerales bacterium]
MSEYYDDEEEFFEGEEGFEGGQLSEAEIMEIQEEYRRRRLIESLVGPVISTLFHVGLIIILAIFITDKYKSEPAEIEVKMEEVEEVQIEEPPPIEEPVEEVIEETDTTNPVLTTVTIENVETNDAALEDVNDEAPSTEDDSTVEAVSDVTVSPSAFASPTVFGGRGAAGRASSVSKYGGSRVGQEKLLKALYWLKKVQNPDGSWADTKGYQQAMTGLALLTFLAHGETPTSKEFGTTVRKAMEWLANSPTDIKGSHAYPHAIKAYALAEAYAMTGVSILEDAMNKSIRIIIDGQNDNGCLDYNYKKHGRVDLSFAGWNYQALKAAYGAGCEEKGLTNAIFKGVEWLKGQAASDEAGKGFPYAIKDGAPIGKGKHTMRAVGVLCLQLFGEGKTPEMKDEIKAISTVDYEKLSWANPPVEALYGWYYATQCMFQQGGKEWKAWNRKFQTEIGNNQNPEGYWESPGKIHGPKPGTLDDKVYATTLCALMLTVYYRYLPSTKGAIGGNAAKKEKKPVMEEEGLDLID